MAGISLKFKDGIKLYGLEQYRDFTIAYISKPHRADPLKEVFLYQIFINNELNAGEANSLEEIIKLAHKDINDFLRKDE